MNRRGVVVYASVGLAGLLSGCLNGRSSDGMDASETDGPTQTAETPTYECDAATRPASPSPDADPPGAADRYTYPTRPDSLSNEEVRSYVAQYERAYRLNKTYSRRGAYLNQVSVSIEETETYEAPDGAAIGQVMYTYDAEIEGDDGPLEIDSPILYASYYVDDEVVLRAADKELQESVSRLVVDPITQGQPVECF
jgi:hypothetical protein